MANDDRGHVALPKLYGAPAYARPPVTPARPVERPFDPDELPLASELSLEDQRLLDQIVARPYDGAASSGEMSPSDDGRPSLRGRRFRLRSLRVFHRKDGPGRDAG